MLERTILLFTVFFYLSAPVGYAQDRSAGGTAKETLLHKIEFAPKQEATRVSPDGRRVAYEVISGSKRLLVVDGQKKVEFNYISGDFFLSRVVFSQDSKRVAFKCAASYGSNYISIDGNDGKRYDYVTDPLFSADGKRVAYMAREGKQWFAVVDGKWGNAYCDYWDSTLVFSPDSRRVAYMAAPTGPWRKETLGETAFLKPEGAATKKEPKWTVVVDGKEEETFDYGTPLLKNGGWEKPKRSGAFVFDSNAKRAAYTALKGSILKLKLKSGRHVQEIEGGLSKRFVVADRKSQKEYSEIRPISLVFSPDGRHLVYTAQIRDKWCVVVNGKERKLYDKILSFKGRVVFESADSFHYVAQQGSNIYLVEETLK
jgi:hypothetical protein